MIYDACYRATEVAANVAKDEVLVLGRDITGTKAIHGGRSTNGGGGLNAPPC